jgi:hypothetical protein
MLGRRPIAAMLAAIVAAALSGMDTGTYVEEATKLPTMEVSIRSPRQHHRRRPFHKRLDQRRVVVGRANCSPAAIPASAAADRSAPA